MKVQLFQVIEQWNGRAYVTTNILLKELGPFPTANDCDLAAQREADRMLDEEGISVDMYKLVPPTE